MVRVYKPETDTLAYDFLYNIEETRALHAELNNKASIDINDLRRISLWKLNRVLSVSQDTLTALQGIATTPSIRIDDERVKETIELLVNSNGVGYPVASAILKFIEPRVFPIIDVRAYRALRGVKLYYTSYTYAIYVDYAHELAAIAAHTGRPLRDIDEQLYCFDIVHNDRI